MSIAPITTRPATAEDVMGLYGKMPPRSVRAWVMEKDGVVVGIAGYFLSGGRAVMFSDMNAPIPAMAIWRASVALMKSMQVPAICVGTEKSAPFLKRLGWVYVGNSSDGMVFEWNR